MTSKDNDGGADAPMAAAAHTDRTTLHQQILDGHRPDADQLRAGAPYYCGDMVRDRKVWCDSHLLGSDLEMMQATSDKFDDRPQLRPLIQNLRDTSSTAVHWSIEHAMRQIGHDDDADRMLIYLACMHDDAARQKLIANTRRRQGWEHDDYDRLFECATSIGLMYSTRKSMDAYCAAGLKIIAEDADALASFNAARETADVTQSSLGAVVAAVARADLLQDVLEDRAEIVRTPSLIVVPTLPEGGSSHRRDLQKSWKGIDGTALPIVGRGDIAAHRRALIAQWPHAAELIDIVLGDLAAQEAVRFRPTLFLGPAGTGKSSLARAICDAVALPCELYNMAGMADASLGGTSAQWSTAREAVPLQLIKRSRMASVAVIWDEVEKASGGSHNGSAMDALLPMLEVDQARRFRDLTLEVECDLSMVSHFATANSLKGIPRPLIDRMRVLTMPEPGWQHLGTLTRQIVERLAKERGVDPRWFAPLAEDEMDLVRSAWPGGSIRQLTRIVTTIIDGRSMLMGRC